MMLSLKRKDSPTPLSSSHTHATPSKKTKHHHNGHDATTQDQTPQVDVTYGQRSFFPASANNGDSEFDEESAAALAYLSSVRQEASGIPHLLVAAPSKPTNNIDNDDSPDDNFDIEFGNDEDGGYYEDGAYLAAPSLGPHLPTNMSSKEANKSAMSAYHSRMLEHFDRIHAQLEPEIQVRREILLPQDLTEVVSRAPLPRWLNSLLDQSVRQLMLAVTARLTKSRLVDNPAKARILGAWCWSLLARTPDVGTLDAAEVGVVREMGKRAARLAENLVDDLSKDPHCLDRHQQQQPILGPPRPPHLATESDGRRRRNSSSSIDSDIPSNDKPIFVKGACILSRAEVLHLSNAAAAATGNGSGDDTAHAETELGESSTAEMQEEGELDENDDDPPTDRKSRFPNDDDDDDDDDEKQFWPSPKDDNKISQKEDDDTDSPLRTRHIAIATLDMILTVAAERFGQRDLLGARDLLWQV